MQQYQFAGMEIDSVELKCLVVSRGVRVDKSVYALGNEYRIHPNALTCNCFKLPDDTIVMLTDLSFHLSTLKSMFSWENLKLMKYMADMTTPFSVRLSEGKPALYHEQEYICKITLLPHTNFYRQKCRSGLPFIGNSVLQGCNWVAFQCLWPCEYAKAGKPCQYCFSGGEYEALAAKGKSMPRPPSPEDVADIVDYALTKAGCDSVQITGGSTFDSSVEERHITSYMEAINQSVHRNKLRGELLLYITPPQEMQVIDRYFALGASRIACSLEVWNDDLAAQITPGKREFTGKQRHLQALEYIADRHGPGKAFSNFIIGLEPLESLKEGATALAQRGIIPSASVWMPFGKPVMGSMKAPSADYYRAVKEMLAELYIKYNLKPAGGCGLNVCVEKDIWNFAHQQ